MGAWEPDSSRLRQMNEMRNSIYLDSIEAAVVAVLLSAGADVNAWTSSGSTALHFAIGLGEPGVVRLLIREGAEVSAKD